MIKYRWSEADKELGCCTTAVKYGNKIYIGEAKLAEGDTWSEIFGCRIAEIRATIKALNAIIDTKRKEYKAIENFIKATTCYKNFDKESPTALCVYRQLNRKKVEIENLKMQRGKLKKFIKDSIEMREKIEKRIARAKDLKETGKEN